MNFSDPHHVWDTKHATLRHNPSEIKLPPQLPDLPGMREDLSRYLDEISHLDGLCEGIFEILKKRGLIRTRWSCSAATTAWRFHTAKGHCSTRDSMCR